MRRGNEEPRRKNTEKTTSQGTLFVNFLMGKLKDVIQVGDLDEKDTTMVKSIVILRLSTKHINLWMRQLEMKKPEMCELAELLRFEEIKKEIEAEKNLEA